MTIRTRAVVVVAAAALILTGCTSDPMPAPSPTVPASAEENRADHDHGDHDTLVPSPTASPNQEVTAAAATDALRAYAQRDLDYTAWFEQLKPHLHPTAVEAYSTVQPSRIPPMEVEDGAEAAATSTETYAVVYVPTSMGEYTIELRRDDAAGSWGVTRFQPPA